MAPPKVSIVLTSFNHAKFLCGAIDSALRQTFTDFELLIFDDASTDGSWDIIQAQADPRIRALRNETTRRGGWGINKALRELARGQYIAIHHSDDAWEPEKLGQQVAHLEAHPETGAVFTQVQVIGEEGLPFSEPGHCYDTVFDQPNRSRHEWLRFFLEHGNALCHPSALVRGSSYAACGPYRYQLAQLNDLDMWFRLCLRQQIHILPGKLTRFRVRTGGQNTSADRKDTRIRVGFDAYHILENLAGLADNAELFAIFPELEARFAGMAAPTRYLVALLCVERNFHGVGAFLGLKMLFALLQDPEMAQKLQDDCGFDVHAFISLTGSQDVFRREPPAPVQQITELCRAALPPRCRGAKTPWQRLAAFLSGDR